MHIHILAFLLFFQSFVACQQVPESALPMASGTDFQSVAAGWQRPGSARLTAANIVFQSVDGGQHWQDVSAGLPQYLQAWCVFAGGGEVFLGAESGLYKGGSAAVPAWEKVLFLDESISDILPGRSGPYACISRSGIFQETLLGTGLWQPMYTDLNDKMVRTVLETPEGTVFVGCDSGIFKSTDRGNTWKQVFAGKMVTSLVAADGVLVGGGLQGLLRSTDGGEHWDLVLTEDGMIRKVGRIGTRLVSISSGVAPWQEVAGDPERMSSRLRTSADGGKTWQRLDENLPKAQSLDTVVGRLSPVRYINDIEQVGNFLFCSLDSGIYRSVDQGKTWELVLPATEKKMFMLAATGEVIFAVLAEFNGC